MAKTKKTLALFIAALAATALFALGACSQPETSSSLGKDKMEVVAEPSANLDLEPFYALFIGNDSRYKTVEDEGGEIADDDPSYGDTLMLARIDPVELEVSLLSIPRDTFCEVNGGPDKINANHLDGPEKMVAAVEDLTGVDISYYFDEHFVDFGQMVDEMGGVTVDVPMGIEWDDILKGGTVELSAGDGQELDGSEALVFVRVRKLYAEYGDACRQNNARQLVQKAITAAAGNSAADASRYADIIMGVCDTNIDRSMLTGLIEQFMGRADDIRFQLGTGPYMDSWAAENEGILAVPRDEAVYAALIDMMENGGDLTSVVPLQPMY